MDSGHSGLPVEPGDASAAVEARKVPGVYAYALPLYMEHPDERGRFPIKVGVSGIDALDRFQSQRRLTWLPEDPVLLRVYSTNDLDARAVEKHFHRLLDLADFPRAHGDLAGSEWFQTTVDFLDAVSEAMRLSTVYVNEPLADDDGDSDFFGGRKRVADEEEFKELVLQAHQQLEEEGREVTPSALKRRLRESGYQASTKRVWRHLPEDVVVDPARREAALRAVETRRARQSPGVTD